MECFSEVDNIFDTERKDVYLVSYNFNLIKYQERVPIVNNCNAEFNLMLAKEPDEDERYCDTKISCQLLISVYIENDELNILVTQKYIKIKEFYIGEYESENIEVLLHKKYPIHMINDFDINQSQLYSITSFSGDYLLKNGALYELNNSTYQLVCDSEDEPSRILKHNGIYLIKLEDSPNKELAIIPPKYTTYMNKSTKKYIELGHKILDFNIIKDIVNAHSQHENYGIIADIQKCGKILDEEELIKKLKEHIKKILRDKQIGYRIINYYYYFSEKTRDLYMFVMLRIHENKDVRFLIVKHKISQPIYKSTIMFLSDELEVTPEQKEKETRKIKDSHKILSGIIKRYKTINKTVNGRNNKNEDIYHINFLNHWFHEVVNKTFGAWFMYDDELVIRYRISFSEVLGEFRDIRHNRYTKILGKVCLNMIVLLRGQEPK